MGNCCSTTNDKPSLSSTVNNKNNKEMIVDTKNYSTPKSTTPNTVITSD